MTRVVPEQAGGEPAAGTQAAGEDAAGEAEAGEAASGEGVAGEAGSGDGAAVAAAADGAAAGRVAADGRTVRREDVDGVAVLRLDVPDSTVNALRAEVFADLRAHLDDVAADSSVVGAVLTSAAQRVFCGGADVEWLAGLEDPAEALAVVDQAHSLLRVMLGFPKPLVAAINGAALGGGLEVALGCHERLAVPHAWLGLPEVTLGLLPGGGGTQSVLRAMPVDAAIEHLLAGQRVRARQAVEVGLVDEVVPSHRLLDRAVERAASGTPGRPPRAAPGPEALDGALAAARQRVERAGNDTWPAPEAIVDVVEAGLREGLDAGLAAEREAFVRLLGTRQARGALHQFLATEHAKRAVRADGRAPRRLVVIGGGQMGAGLGVQAMLRGLDARVHDVDEAALVGVHQRAERALRSKFDKPGQRYPIRRRQLYHRLSTMSSLNGLRLADLVVEAVFEDAALKREVLADAESRMRDDAVLASNTSAIRIAELAECCERPERFLGMHFFSPVERMPLVEIIPHEGTADETVAAALAAADRLGKIPVVVGDAPGFFTSRVYARWLVEGLRLLIEGARIERVDAAAKAAGFPVGPLAAHDHASLALVARASLDQVASRVFAGRVDERPARALLEALIAAGHEGRACNQGFYRYDADGRRREANDEVYAVAGLPGSDEVPDTACGERLLWAFISEAILCWDEQVLRDPAAGDVAAVKGIGFPRHLGGPFFHVDELGIERAQELLRGLGEPAFSGADALGRLASAGQRFATW